jgi:hypothetical protein
MAQLCHRAGPGWHAGCCGCLDSARQQPGGPAIRFLVVSIKKLLLGLGGLNELLGLRLVPICRASDPASTTASMPGRDYAVPRRVEPHAIEKVGSLCQLFCFFYLFFTKDRRRYY